MIINGVNSSSGTLYQTVTIPSGGANLSFWLNITTSEAAGAPVFDRLFIEVRSTGGTLLATLATFSNQNSGTAGVYVLRGPLQPQFIRRSNCADSIPWNQRHHIANVIPN